LTSTGTAWQQGLMKFGPRLLVFAIVLAASVGCDQASKHIATATLQPHAQHPYLGDLFRWQLERNQGAFLSLGASMSPELRYWVFVVAVGILLFGITGYALRSAKLDAWQVAGYGFIAGGGFSNWFDRARFGGEVVDFMNMGIGDRLRTGIFNVADLAIIVGIAVLMIHGWVQEKKAKTAAAQAAKPA
jgi:signal peptidase II